METDFAKEVVPYYQQEELHCSVTFDFEGISEAGRALDTPNFTISSKLVTLAVGVLLTRLRFVSEGQTNGLRGMCSRVCRLLLKLQCKGTRNLCRSN
jgi:hypothetical protein